MSNDRARGWSKAQWDAWYADQRRKSATAKSSNREQGWERPPTLNDAVNVTIGSRIVANQLAQQMHRDHPNLSFQECVYRVFAQYPGLYDSEVAASEHVQEAHYQGRSLT